MELSRDEASGPGTQHSLCALFLMEAAMAETWEHHISATAAVSLDKQEVDQRQTARQCDHFFPLRSKSVGKFQHQPAI